MYAYNCTDMDGMNCSHLTTVIIFVMVGVLEHPKTGFISDVGIIVGFFFHSFVDKKGLCSR